MCAINTGALVQRTTWEPCHTQPNENQQSACPLICHFLAEYERIPIRGVAGGFEIFLLRTYVN
jgi:hypothetical protein